MRYVMQIRQWMVILATFMKTILPTTSKTLLEMVSQISKISLSHRLTDSPIWIQEMLAKRDMTRSQMLQRTRCNMQAKLWRLVGRTQNVSRYPKLHTLLKMDARSDRWKSIVWPGQWILKKNLKTAFFRQQISAREVSKWHLGNLFPLK